MCDKCPFKSGWQGHLKTHMENKHGTEILSCDLCDYKTMLPIEFKKHWGYRHDPSVKRYPCDQCHYSATFVHALKLHIQIVHEGVKYPCDMCEYQGSTKADVMKHRNNIHKKIKHPCDLCNLIYTTDSALRHHRKQKHPVEYVKYARAKKNTMH